MKQALRCQAEGFAYQKKLRPLFCLEVLLNCCLIALSFRLHRIFTRDAAAILQRIASAESGYSGNPLQPEPPRLCSRYSDCIEARGGPGEASLFASPGGFPPISTRESGLLPLRGFDAAETKEKLSSCFLRGFFLPFYSSARKRSKLRWKIMSSSSSVRERALRRLISSWGFHMG